MKIYEIPAGDARLQEAARVLETLYDPWVIKMLLSRGWLLDVYHEIKTKPNRYQDGLSPNSMNEALIKNLSYQDTLILLGLSSQYDTD